MRFGDWDVPKRITRSKTRLLYLLTSLTMVIVVFAIIGFKKGIKKQKQLKEALLKMANTDKLTGDLQSPEV